MKFCVYGDEINAANQLHKVAIPFIEVPSNEDTNQSDCSILNNLSNSTKRI